MDFKGISLMEKDSLWRLHTIWLYLHDILRMAKQ